MLLSDDFYTIFESNECKFEYSNHKKFLRKTFYERIDFFSVKKIKEEMYIYVKKDVAEDKIKKIDGKWISYSGKQIYNIKIYEHIDSKKFITGWHKTVRKVGKNCYKVRYYKRIGAEQ